jgi:hypothetical protein
MVMRHSAGLPPGSPVLFQIRKSNRHPDRTTDGQLGSTDECNENDLNRHALHGIAIQRRWAPSKDYVARKQSHESTHVFQNLLQHERTLL